MSPPQKINCKYNAVIWLSRKYSQVIICTDSSVTAEWPLCGLMFWIWQMNELNVSICLCLCDCLCFLQLHCTELSLSTCPISFYLLLRSHFSVHWYVMLLTLCSSVAPHLHSSSPQTHTCISPPPFFSQLSGAQLMPPSTPTSLSDCLLFVTFFLLSCSPASHRSFYQSQSAVTV